MFAGGQQNISLSSKNKPTQTWQHVSDTETRPWQSGIHVTVIWITGQTQLKFYSRHKQTCRKDNKKIFVPVDFYLGRKLKKKKKILNYCHQTMDHIHKISLQPETTRGKKIMNWQLAAVFFQEARNNTSRAVSLHHISTGAAERQPFISSLRGAPVFARRGGEYQWKYLNIYSTKPEHGFTHQSLKDSAKHRINQV